MNGSYGKRSHAEEANAEKRTGSQDGSSSAATSLDGPNFVPSATWQGSKFGYYFGTAEQGTGYYRDHPKDEAPRKRPKRSVQIAEDRNETRTIPSADALLEQAEQDAANTKVVDLTRKGVRSAAVGLNKAVEKNELKRAEHADQPDHYMESEVTLYENISALKAIAADPSLLYPVVLESDLPATLSQLLAHDNADIVASVALVFLEWLDPSLLEDDEGNLIPSVIELAAIVIRDGLEMLVANLARLQSSQDDDDEVGKGIENVLSLVENLLEIDMSMSTTPSDNVRLLPPGQTVASMLGKNTTLVSWLLQQIESEQPSSDRCLEILALLAPLEEVHSILPDWSRLPLYSTVFLENEKPKSTKADDGDKKESKVVDGIEILLQTIATYRKKQPSDDEAIDSLENACDIMASLLTFSPANVQAFLNAQGIQLAIRCMKERVHAGGVTLKWLDFSGSDPVYKKACEYLVDAGALKYIFPLFMGRNLPKMAPTPSATKKAKKEWQQAIETTSIRILYALTRYLSDDSPNDVKQRLLAKFVDDEKCDRLVELLLAYDQKARMAEYKFFRSDVEESLKDEDAVQLSALEAKLAGGGDIFHRLGAITAFCCIGSRRCHERIMSQLHLQQSGIGLIRDALEEFVSVLGDSDQKEQLQGYLEKI